MEHVHGLIFTAFRTFTESEYPAVHDELWGTSDRYLATAAYTDEEFAAVVAAASRLTRESADRVLRRFGMYAGVSAFRLLYPAYYSTHTDTLSFLLNVEHQIHDTVRQTVPDAAPPRLDVTPVDDATVMITYTSARELCALLEGLVAGVGRFYGDRLQIDHTLCMKRGDAAGCTFVVTRL